MYRKRLRPRLSDALLNQICAEPHDSREWWDHNIRVDVTIAMGRGMLPRIASRAVSNPYKIADLSTGNALIPRGIAEGITGAHTILGDYAPGYMFQGRIEDNIEKMPAIDLYVCGETLEHLDDPDTVLKQIRRKADMLLMSTPIAEQAPSNNIEHYWGWDRMAVQEMLTKAGFLNVMIYNELVFPGLDYDFQIWGVS